MTIEISPEARQAVAAGFAYAGPMGSNEAAWRAKLNEGVLRATAAMTGRVANMAQEMLEAQIFSGEYGGYTDDPAKPGKQPSTRLIVKIRSEGGREKSKDADGFEPIRTDRTDGALGRTMKRRLDALPIGSKILVWKVMEAMAGAEDGEKARVLRHFEFLAPPADQSSTPPASQASSRPPSAPPARGAAPPADDVETTDVGPIVARLNSLPGPKQANYAKRCRSEGINNFVRPDDDHLDRCLVILSEVEAS